MNAYCIILVLCYHDVVLYFYDTFYILVFLQFSIFSVWHSNGYDNVDMFGFEKIDLLHFCYCCAAEQYK